MKDDVVVPVLGSAVGLLGAILIAIALFWTIKSRRKLIAQKSRSILVEMKLRRFSYGELVKMTDNFQRRIGQGGFGNVYHGQLDGAPVAVKLYRNQRPSAATEFQTEVNHLNKVYHKNLIKVVGYYEESTKSALVFELMANGDLKKNLTGSGPTKLTWERRLRIAIDIAKALDYLHDGCQPPIIHRDVNSTNILLSENFEVKLSGFALAVNLIPPHEGESHVSITIAGTYGYMDPQYLMTGKLSIGTDVYGFGVVLMEIITGKSAIPAGIQIDGEGVILTQWVSSMFANGEIGRIVDPKLEGNFDVYSVEEALKIALACVSHNSNDRPTMGEVVLKLKHCLQIQTPRFNQTISVS